MNSEQWLAGLHFVGTQVALPVLAALAWTAAVLFGITCALRRWLGLRGAARVAIAVSITIFVAAAYIVEGVPPGIGDLLLMSNFFLLPVLLVAACRRKPS